MKIVSFADLRDGTARVEVEWVDSGSDDGWTDEDAIRAGLEDDAQSICVTVGYLIHEDDQKIAVCQSLAKMSRSGREMGNVLTIPRVAVVAVRQLRR